MRMTDPGSRTALRVLIADDHPFFRAGLRLMLEADGMEIVGEAAEGNQAVELARALLPDIVLMDVHMPLGSGTDATREIVSSCPGIQVLVLSASATDTDITRAIAAGASGYLLKDTAADDLVGAIRQAATGNTVLSGEVAALVLRLVRVQAPAHSAGEAGGSLTVRELQVLRLIADGSGNDAIGRVLFISPNTVKQHVANIIEKLGVNSRVQAAVHGVRHGLI